MAWSGGVTSPEWSYKHRKSRLQLAVFLTSPSFRDWQVPSIHLLNAGHKLTGVTSQVFDTVRLWTAFSYILTPESEPTNTIPLSVPGLSPLPCSLAEGGALFNTDESPESVVHPVGGKARGRGPPPLSLDTLTHTCLMPFFFFFFLWTGAHFKQIFLRLSHPALCGLHREWAREEGHEEEEVEEEDQSFELT